jgi:hypothetical protein
VRTLSCVASVNPWLELPSRAPFILPADEPHVDAFNAALDQSNTTHRIIEDWPPGPFAGCLGAPVVVLLANPGWSETGLAEQCAPGALKPILEAIMTPEGTPVWPLTDRFADTEPGKWWRARTRDLAVEVGGFGVLARRLLMVELHGYHSREWVAPRVTFPSQRYGFELVRAAMDRGGLIVVARCMRHWHAAVPGLRQYENQVGLASPRSGYLSRGNLKKNFPKVVGVLTDQR